MVNDIIKSARIVALIAWCLTCSTIYAQESSRALTMQEAIDTALQQNKKISIAAIDEKIARANYRQTEAVFLPQASFSYSAFTTNNPLDAFGFKLQQQDVKQQDFNPSILNHPGPTPDFSTQIGIQQPLLNLDMLYTRKSAQKQIEVQYYKTQRTQDYIIWQVKQAYMQLSLAYDALQVLKESLITAKATDKFINDRYQQGLLQKYDMLNAQVQVTAIETNIAETNSNISNASDGLSLLMNKPLGIVYAVTTADDNISTDTINTLPDGRADFKATEIALQSYDLMIKSSRMQYLPHINAFAGYQLNDKNMLGFGGSGYLAGLQLNWSIFNGLQTKNKIAAQLIERNKIASQLEEQKDESRVELNKTQRVLADACYKITQQQQAVEECKEALRILQNRFSQGLVNTTDVLMAQTQLAQQKLALAQALFAQRSALIYLQFLTSINK